MKNYPLIAQDELTLLANNLGIKDWEAFMTFVKQIPYGRNADRSDVSLVLKNNKGTCSSKHALLKSIADLNAVPEVQLILGMYKMSEQNTPKIGSVLSDNGLAYIPEAHCYLKINGTRKDLTNEESDISKLEADIIEEQSIQPEQVGVYKVEFHQAYMKKWLATNDVPFSFDELWQIREQCIQNLSG